MTQKYKVQVSMNQAAIVKTGLVLKQGDFGMQVEIEVLDFDVSNTTPQIVFRKLQGAVEATTITVSNNKYTYTFRGTELDIPGRVICDLKLKNSTTQRISSASFAFEVVPDTLDGLAEEASSYSDTIEQIIGDAVTALNNQNCIYKYNTWRNFLTLRRSLPVNIKSFKFTPDDNSISTANIFVSGKNILRNTTPHSSNMYGVTWKTDEYNHVIANGTPTGYTYITLGKFYVVKDVPYTVIFVDGEKNKKRNILYQAAGTNASYSTIDDRTPFVPTQNDVLTLQIKRKDNNKPIKLNGQVMVIVGKHDNPDEEIYKGEFTFTYNVTNETGFEECKLYPGYSTIVSDVPGKIEAEFYTSPYTDKKQNIFLSFITPSYSDSAGGRSYYPNDYALGLSYDGKSFSEINNSQYICKDFATGADQFKGGNDTFIFKVDGYYICIAQNYNPTTGAWADYVITRDFLNYTPVRHFNGFDIAAYIQQEYSHTITDNRVWEPSLFSGLNGEIYIMASAQYKADENYPFQTSTTIKYFVQVYGQVTFNKQTLELEAVGSLNQFEFPDGVDTVIDVSILPRNSDYIFCYKDEKTLRSHVATLANLTSKPVNTMVNNLLGRDFVENPYLINYNGYHLVFATSYGSLLNRAQYVTSCFGFGRVYSQICSVNSPLIENFDGTKCRSLHPFIIDDEEILNIFDKFGYVIAPSTNDYTSSKTYSTLKNEFGIYYGLTMQLESARTYRIVEDISIKLSNKWNDDTFPLRFITDGQSHVLTINNVSKTLPADGSVTMFDRLTNKFII